MSTENKFPIHPADVYDTYADMLFRLAFSHLQTKEDAEDAVQEVFVKYVTKNPQFTDASHQQAWLIRVTINQCHDLIRRHSYRDHAPIHEILEPADEDRHEQWILAADVMQGLAKLPEKYRTVVVLHYLEDFSISEIAAMLKISESAVKMRLSRGRALSKDLFKEDHYV